MVSKTPFKVSHWNIWELLFSKLCFLEDLTKNFFCCINYLKINNCCVQDNDNKPLYFDNRQVCLERSDHSAPPCFSSNWAICDFAQTSQTLGLRYNSHQLRHSGLQYCSDASLITGSQKTLCEDICYIAAIWPQRRRLPSRQREPSGLHCLAVCLFYDDTVVDLKNEVLCIVRRFISGI